MSETASPPQVAAPPSEPGFIVRQLNAIYEFGEALLGEFGGFWKFVASTFFWMIRRPYRWRLLVEQMHVLGVGTAMIIILSGFFVGAVFTFQSLFALRRMGG